MSDPRSASPAASQPAPNTAPTIPLGDLLHQFSLGIVLIAGVTEDAPDRPVQWVHVSELEDPTPFLPPRTALLTTGARFSSIPTQYAADAYVARLIDAGTTALGIGIGLHLDRVPPRFVSACDRLGLPLFRVPYDTAFIEIVQSAAQLLNARTRERDLWLLDAQRALTAAMVQTDGLASTVREAAHRLERWVGVVDRSGRIVEAAMPPEHPPLPTDWIERETAQLVSRGASAGRIGADDGSGRNGIQMITLGRRLLGVLVVEDRGTPDHAERTLLGHVAALATLLLEHRAGLDEAEASLRSSIAQLLVAGQVPLAERLATETETRVPHDPVQVVSFDDPLGEGDRSGNHGQDFAADLRSLDAGSTGLLVATLDGTRRVISEPRHLPAIRRLLAQHRAAAGISERGAREQLGELLEQSERALEHARAGENSAPLQYAPALHDGVLRLLAEQPAARERAYGMLAPIRHHDERHGDRLEDSLRIWLSHHGQTSPAASEIGVHRHTLRSRIETAERLLQRDLDSPDVRAELWAALRLAS